MAETPDRSYVVRLRRVLDAHLSESEVRALCFDLGVDYDDLPGRGKTTKIVELLGHFERRLRIFELVQAGSRHG